MSTLKSRYNDLWLRVEFSFIYNTIRQRQTQPATGAENIGFGGLNFTYLFQTAEINKHKGPQRLRFSPVNLFWDLFTKQNTGNHFHHGINITANQRLSPTFRRNRNTIIVSNSQMSLLPIFSEGGGTSVHRLLCTCIMLFGYFLDVHCTVTMQNFPKRQLMGDANTWQHYCFFFFFFFFEPRYFELG